LDRAISVTRESREWSAMAALAHAATNAAAAGTIGGCCLGGAAVMLGSKVLKLCLGKRASAPASAPEAEEDGPASEGRIPIFVMMPLDTVTDDCGGIKDPVKIKEWLVGLVASGVRGIMVDVWWGLCEPAPGKYRFHGYVELCQLCKDLGLKLQAVMSFHQCGGNVGDSVSIPIPAWALEPAKTSGFLYQAKSGSVSQDCLSLSADRERIFPAVGGGKRDALACYREFMAAFASATAAFLGNVIVEIQVGMGPCGELRYPSYMLSWGWNYPGVGLLMAYDSGMRRMLAQAARTAPVFANIPESAPTEQNGKPEDCPLFRAKGGGGQFRSGHGAFFLRWYSQVLLAHGDAVLREACAAFPAHLGSSLAFSVKVSGIHWHTMHPSRAAETCAGYSPSPEGGVGAYTAIARMLAHVGRDTGRRMLFNFTCLEMQNGANVPGDDSAPEDLIAEVRRACVQEGVPLCGENALQFGLPESPWALNQIGKQARGWAPGHDKMHSVTLLRLDEGFARPSSLRTLRKWVATL